MTLGSGSGWLERKHGLTADSLRSADVVTADGRLTAASPQADSELFWGLCGGGGNLGVVTELEFALHPIAPQVLAGMLLYPGEQATAIIEGFRALMAKAPDQLGAMLALLSAPVADWVPERLRGRPAVAVLGGWLETPERGEGALERLRGLGSVAVDAVRPRLPRRAAPGPGGPPARCAIAGPLTVSLSFPNRRSTPCSRTLRGALAEKPDAADARRRRVAARRARHAAGRAPRALERPCHCNVV